MSVASGFDKYTPLATSTSVNNFYFYKCYRFCYFRPFYYLPPTGICWGSSVNMANETSDIGLTQNWFILIHVINNGMRHIECKRQNRFKTQDCRVIGVGSNAFWSDFSFPILTSNKKREAATIEAFILGLIRNLLLSKVSFYSTLVTLKKLSKVGVQTEWQRIKKSQRSRPEPKSAWYGRQPNLQSLSMHLRRHGILYDLISGTGPESDENQWLNTY